MKAVTYASWILALVLPMGRSPQVGDPTRTADASALTKFTEAAAAYSALRQEAAAALPPARTSANPAEISERVEALAAAVRARRPHARAGDLFTPEVAAALRRLIDRSLSAHGESPSDVIARNRAELIAGGPDVAVNRRFPWRLGAQMPLCLIEDLPALPAGMQYRLVLRDLILLDVETGLVVDVLRDALPVAVELQR